MQKAIQAAAKIRAKINEDATDILDEINMVRVFAPLKNITDDIRKFNLLVCYIIYAYDNHSPWLDINKDRWTNKEHIIEGLGEDPKSDFWLSVIMQESEHLSDVVANYLMEITTWEWQTILTHLDYHARMIRYVQQNTNSQAIVTTDKDGTPKYEEVELEPEKVAKINKDKADVLSKCLQARDEAERLLNKIRAGYVATDNAVQADFGFMITDEKTIDIYSWRQFIRQVHLPRKELLKKEFLRRNA
jgi:hypothetical protein